ncbi:hypothetical protein N1F91_17925 [Aquibium sp. ELW1220]|nr:hypothetical protein [Aquibium sp. ELW1220]MDN2581870.1 hypothetical protein [Aquibium sp. ELW1220]
MNLPAGPNPSARGELYGNMLQPADGRNGWNFLTSSIYETARTRQETNVGAVEPNRLYNNMLGSQPMCFNLLGPLANNPDLADPILYALPGPAGRRLELIEFEHVPEGNLLNDRTAFDAFIRYSTSEGKAGFLAIETKLTEPFSQESYSPSLARYATWLAHEKSWWDPELSERLENKAFNQLWRDHLLAFSTLHRDEPQFDEGFFAVIHHDLARLIHEFAFADDAGRWYAGSRGVCFTAGGSGLVERAGG